MALKNTSEQADASRNLGLFEKPEAEQPGGNEIDRDDDVEQPRNDKNENTGDESDNWLQMRNTDDHDELLNWLATERNDETAAVVPLASHAVLRSAPEASASLRSSKNPQRCESPHGFR